MLKRLLAVLPVPALLLLAALLAAGAAAMGARGGLSLEERAERVLSQTAGAGRVRVVVHTRTAQSAGLLERQAQEIPCGAVAVAQGASDPLVRAELTQALCALLGLPASAVSVIEGGEM